MSRSRNLLFIKSSRKSSYARSWILDDHGMHSRIIGDALLLGEILSSAQFDVVLLEQHGAPEELIPAIEGMRRFQPTAKLVVMSDPVGISEIKQAMRYNVHDIFLPPYDLPGIVERIEIDMARVGGVRPLEGEAMLTRWSELVKTLSGELNVVVTQTGEPEPEDIAAAEAKETPEELMKKTVELAHEVAALKRRLEDAAAEKSKLSDQIQRLSINSNALVANEARMRDLEIELSEMKGGRGSGSADASEAALREALQQALERVAQLEAGAPASGGMFSSLSIEDDGALQQAAERIQQLETELAEANERFDAAGQAFGSEIELMMAREAQAQAALAEAEEREREARRILETAGDAFNRADETLEVDRAEIQAAREEIKRRQAEQDAVAESLEQREQLLAEKTEALGQLGADFEAEGAQLVADAMALAEGIQKVETRHGRIAELVASLRGVRVE